MAFPEKDFEEVMKTLKEEFKNEKIY